MTDARAALGGGNGWLTPPPANSNPGQATESNDGSKDDAAWGQGHGREAELKRLIGQTARMNAISGTVNLKLRLK